MSRRTSAYKEKNINTRKGRQHLDRKKINKKECELTLDRILRNPINLLRLLHIWLKVEAAIATPAGVSERLEFFAVFRRRRAR